MNVGGPRAECGGRDRVCGAVTADSFGASKGARGCRARRVQRGGVRGVTYGMG